MRQSESSQSVLGGGSPEGLLSSFRRKYNRLYEEKEFCLISVRSKNCGRGQAWSSSAQLALGARIVAAFSFRRFCKSLYGGERIYVGENPIASYEAGYGVGNELTGTTLKSFSSLYSADFANRIMERKLAQLVERRVKFP